MGPGFYPVHSNPFLLHEEHSVFCPLFLAHEVGRGTVRLIQRCATCYSLSFRAALVSKGKTGEEPKDSKIRLTRKSFLLRGIARAILLVRGTNSPGVRNNSCSRARAIPLERGTIPTMCDMVGEEQSLQFTRIVRRGYSAASACSPVNARSSSTTLDVEPSS